MGRKECGCITFPDGRTAYACREHGGRPLAAIIHKHCNFRISRLKTEVADWQRRSNEWKESFINAQEKVKELRGGCIVETCDYHHDFFKAPGSDQRCPFCLAIGLNEARSRLLESARANVALRIANQRQEARTVELFKVLKHVEQSLTFYPPSFSNLLADVRNVTGAPSQCLERHVFGEALYRCAHGQGHEGEHGGWMRESGGG